MAVQPRSLLVRLAWWFAFSLLALYGIPAVLVYFYASARAREYAELTLKTEAEALASYVAGSGALDAPELEEAETTPIPIWLRVVRQGRILAQTPATPELPVIVERGKDGEDEEVVSVRETGTRPVYMVVRHRIGGKGAGASVEAIGSLEPLLAARRRLGAQLFLVGLLLIPLAAVGGRLLAKRALSPIAHLVRVLGGLDPNRLEQRLPAMATEEVAVLSNAFNGLLDRLEESVLRIRRFTADASHEIRNPLGVLRSGLDIALRHERSGGEYRELLRQNLQEVERLQTVLEGVLLLARDAPGGEMRLARSAVDLGELVRATVAFFVAYAAERAVTFETDVEPGLIVSGDPGLLRLVVFNLLDNALKHGPDGEAVQVSARRQNGAVVLRVADRGPGVPPADRERIFERFFRGGPAAGTGVGGIGLDVVRRVAQAHGGSVALLDSERGALFEVRLPDPGA